MARRKKSLHHNLQDGENVVFHREHRSKRGRNKINKADSDIFFKNRREKNEARQGVDKKTLRYLQKRYNISI